MRGVPGDVWRKPNIKGPKAASLSTLAAGGFPGVLFRWALLRLSLCQGAGAGFNNEPKGLEVCCSPLASAGDEREQRLDFSGRLLCLLRIGQLSTVEPLKVKVPR